MGKEEFKYIPEWEEAYNILERQLEVFPLIESGNTTAAIDDFFSVIYDYIRNSPADGSRKFWNDAAVTIADKVRVSGFANPIIREQTLLALERASLLTDTNIKYLLFGVFKREDCHLLEFEVLTDFFRSNISDDNAELLDYLADNTGELFGKIPIMAFLANLDPLKSRATILHYPQVEGFLLSREWIHLAKLGFIEWHANTLNLPDRPVNDTTLRFRDIFKEEISSQAFQEYIRDTKQACATAWQQFVEAG